MDRRSFLGQGAVATGLVIGRGLNLFSEDVKGALVTAVTAGSPAQEKEIVIGDVIVEAAGKPVDTAQAVAKSIAAASESISLKVVNSKGERRDVTVPVPKKPAGGSAPFLPGPK